MGVPPFAHRRFRILAAAAARRPVEAEMRVPPT
jgi:hypothetical protein